MPEGPIVRVSHPCECGDWMLYRKRWFRGWRLECVCGRCGPWRSRPETERAKPQLIIQGHQATASTLGPLPRGGSSLGTQQPKAPATFTAKPKANE